MGSHSVTCHPTEVNAPRLNPSQIGRYSIYLPRRDGRLSWHRRLVIYRDGLPARKQSPIAKSLKQTNVRLKTLWNLLYMCRQCKSYLQGKYFGDREAIRIVPGQWLEFYFVCINLTDQLYPLLCLRVFQCRSFIAYIVSCRPAISHPRLYISPIQWALRRMSERRY